jgi:hypothetical protein
MSHLHSVYDTDTHLKIDGFTRAITNQSTTKNIIVQHDHNSERITFELPRYIDGHDMSTCNVVQVHYINIDQATKAQNKGLYEVDDLQISPDSTNVVICSWLISGNATQYVGGLSFIVRFSCVTNGNIDYAWNTSVFSGISVSSGIYNSEAIVEQYADVLESWENRLMANIPVVLTQEEYDVLVAAGTVSENTLYFIKEDVGK